MANKNFDFNFDIPIPLIVIALFISWPIGVILAILRGISVDNKKKNKKTSNERIAPRGVIEEKYRQGVNQAPNSNYNNEDKKAIIALLIIALILGLAVFFGLASVLSLENIFVTLLPISAALIAFFIGYSFSKKKKVEDSRIRAIIGDRDSIHISKLASACSLSLKKVRKKVQRLIDRGEYGPYAYIDLGTDNFMRNPYAQPDSQVSSDFKSQYKGTTEDTKHSVPETGNENFDSILLEIRRLNDEILDEKVSNKIYEIEGYTKNIFAYVSEHPSAQAQIGTFMNYYLPTTLKLLESYSRIEKVGVAGENMKSSKQKIEDILDLLSTGYKQQLDQLFKNESIDISSDIKVLETMMQKDGLDGKNDFDISAFTDGYSDDVNGQGGAAAK